MKTGIELIAEERHRQISEEGYPAAHDDVHNEEEMAKAAACYALPEADRLWIFGPGRLFQVLWPWDVECWKPTPRKRIRELVKAGALVAAEIDRLQRAKGGDR